MKPEWVSLLCFGGAKGAKCVAKFVFLNVLLAANYDGGSSDEDPELSSEEQEGIGDAHIGQIHCIGSSAKDTED